MTYCFFMKITSSLIFTEILLWSKSRENEYLQIDVYLTFYIEMTSVRNGLAGCKYVTI